MPVPAKEKKNLSHHLKKTDIKTSCIKHSVAWWDYVTSNVRTPLDTDMSYQAESIVTIHAL
jgi:hypothetical protein